MTENSFLVVWKSSQVESDFLVEVNYYQVLIFLLILEVKLMDNLWEKELDQHPQYQKLTFMPYICCQIHFC